MRAGLGCFAGAGLEEFACLAQFVADGEEEGHGVVAGRVGERGRSVRGFFAGIAHPCVEEVADGLEFLETLDGEFCAGGAHAAAH